MIQNFISEHLSRNDTNPVIQRALRVLEDSKSRHIVATREVIYIDNFRKDVERSEARKRKIRKELARLEQGQSITTFVRRLVNNRIQ